MRRLLLFLLLIVGANAVMPIAYGQSNPDLQQQVQKLTSQTHVMQSQINALRSEKNKRQLLRNDGFAAFISGVLCALWAQNTRRNAWVWFFLGLIFSVITLLVMLYKNSKDRSVSGLSSP